VNRHLPVVNGRVAESSIRTDGTRKVIHPARVRGRFITARRIVFVLLIAVWILLPIVHVDGRPLLFLDVEHRRFFVLGTTFGPQDMFLVFFLVTALAFGLAYATALVGRVWCGWACPQTVFLEGVFRPIENMTKPIAKQNAALGNIARHALFLVAALFVAHVFVAYFVSLPALWSMMRHAPREHPEAFAWMTAMTALFYGNFAFFREQMCVVLCPYGRLQSMLVDDDSLVIGYDERRGEPRGKKGKTSGDCVDCNRCVVVCPTGIDIRNGLQLDCIACAQCVDACDEIMDHLGRPRGLVRYDSLGGLRGEKRRILRPRIYLYTAMAIVGAIVALLAARTRTTYEATLLRLPGAPFTREAGVVRNGFELHIVNKTDLPQTFVLEPESAPGLVFVVPMRSIDVEPLRDRRVPVFVTTAGPGVVTDRGGAAASPRPKLRIRVHAVGETRVVEAVFLGGAS
jgi:cytochrome c oxidase accessory protein FixG